MPNPAIAADETYLIELNQRFVAADAYLDELNQQFVLEWSDRLVRLGLEEPASLLANLLTRYPECAAELNLLGRCGEKLAEVLRGDTDPLSLLFPEGTQSGAAVVYHDDMHRATEILLQ